MNNKLFGISITEKLALKIIGIINPISKIMPIKSLSDIEYIGSKCYLPYASENIDRLIFLRICVKLLALYTVYPEEVIYKKIHNFYLLLWIKNQIKENKPTSPTEINQIKTNTIYSFSLFTAHDYINLKSIEIYNDLGLSKNSQLYSLRRTYLILSETKKYQDDQEYIQMLNKLNTFTSSSRAKNTGTSTFSRAFYMKIKKSGINQISSEHYCGFFYIHIINFVLSYFELKYLIQKHTETLHHFKQIINLLEKEEGSSILANIYKKYAYFLLYVDKKQIFNYMLHIYPTLIKISEKEKNNFIKLMILLFDKIINHNEYKKLNLALIEFPNDIFNFLIFNKYIPPEKMSKNFFEALMGDNMDGKTREKSIVEKEYLIYREEKNLFPYYLEDLIKQDNLIRYSGIKDDKKLFHNNYYTHGGLYFDYVSNFYLWTENFEPTQTEVDSELEDYRKILKKNLEENDFF